MPEVPSRPSADHEPWHRAQWLGVGFWSSADHRRPPQLALLFRNLEPAELLFEQLINRLTKVDRHEEWRVCIIEGQLPGQPFKTSIALGAHEENVRRRAEKVGSSFSPDWPNLPSAIQTLTHAPDAPDLADWKKAYLSHGRYLLLPVRWGTPPTPSADFAIEKREICFRRYDEIGEDEPDYLAVIQASV